VFWQSIVSSISSRPIIGNGNNNSNNNNNNDATSLLPKAFD
jgi:hypothetical protein